MKRFQLNLMKYCFTTTEFDTKEISDVCEMKIFLKDLISNTFCVPILYRHSPPVYIIMNEIPSTQML